MSNQATFKLDNESTDRIIKDQLIYKDNQLKIILKKYIEITCPTEQLNEEKLSQMTQEFLKDINVYEFQIAKAARQLEAQNYDREQNQELHRSITERIQATDLEIEQLRKIFQVEEQIKNNKSVYEELATHISHFQDLQNVVENIDKETKQIVELKAKHKKSMKIIKQKEKQLSLMLHLMNDLIEQQKD